MERLTRVSKNGTGMIWFIDHNNNNIDVEPCEMTTKDIRIALERLAYYEDLEERYKLIAPLPHDDNPCLHCDSGWASISSTKCTSCSDSCLRLKEYHERHGVINEH